MKIRFPLPLLLAFGLWIAACSPKKSALPISEFPTLDSLFTSYQEENLKLFPLQATTIGDNRYNDQLPNTLTQTYRSRVKAFYSRYREQLLTFDRNTLSDNDQLSYDILLYHCDINLEGLGFKDYLMPISQIRSLTLTVAQLASGTGNQPFGTVPDYDNWLKRLDGYVEWCDSAMVNMRKGMESGYVIPKVNAAKVIPQLANFDHGPVKDHLFYRPVLNMPTTFSPEDARRLTTAYEVMIETKIIPAHQRLKKFIAEEYLPACRETSGIDGIPGGNEFYAYALKRFTTTSMSADEIFALGHSEVERISKEMEAVKTQVGFKGDLKSFFEHLRSKKELMPFKSGEEVIARYNAIHEQMKPQLTRLFDQVPKMDFEVRRIEAYREATSSAHYSVGIPGGARPGIFYFPLRDVKKYSTMPMEDLFLHEAIPGHHYQIALKVENTSIPNFRRFSSDGAYTEGWGLYAESLGKELGLYKDPYSYFGMLAGEMHRAIRLVTDAGLHSQGWTREQAIQYFKDHGPSPEETIISEIERYMANPGQAVSYKIGHLKILELRARAEKELGSRFDVRQFHNEMLNAGSLPLHLLEAKIDRWINRVKHA
ncbi:MAG: DUF885 domain-containing protein [Cytophagales bacterium]|mgnify:CR=1 FL=1|nr:DUF885 domain-containing protein [Cytophagales bacterium]